VETPLEVEGTSFPICESKTVYDDKKRRQTRGMTRQAISAIDAVKPYKGGNDFLWRLNERNNIDKHRLLLVAGSAVRSMDIGGYIQQGTPPGSRLSQIEGFSFFMKPKDKRLPSKDRHVGLHGPDDDRNQKTYVTIRGSTLRKGRY
jgi:hypothetical protein